MEEFGGQNAELREISVLSTALETVRELSNETIACGLSG